MTDLGPTVLDALGMRSGIPEFFTDRVLRDQLRRPDRHVTTAEMLALVPDEPSQPNVTFDYSNTNYLLLGQLVETGDWRAVRRCRPAHGLTGPLQLEETNRGPGPWRDRGCPWRGRTSQAARPFLPNRSVASAAWAAGGMAGDAESVARWGYLLYGGPC